MSSLSYFKRRNANAKGGIHVVYLPVPVNSRKDGRGIKRGSGVVNTLIDYLPFEAHVPGYNFLGPGTKLAKKLLNNTQGINKLDNLAREHDIAYAKTSDLDQRHDADYKLQEGAWNRVLASDAGLGEKAAAWATTNAMKLKRFFGLGLPGATRRRRRKRKTNRKTGSGVRRKTKTRKKRKTGGRGMVVLDRPEALFGGNRFGMGIRRKKRRKTTKKKSSGGGIRKKTKKIVRKKRGRGIRKTRKRKLGNGLMDGLISMVNNNVRKKKISKKKRGGGLNYIL